MLLRELVSRWSETHGGFRVRSLYVPFTPLDVYYTLGLPILGNDCWLGDEGLSIVASLFGEQELKIDTIVKC